VTWVNATISENWRFAQKRRFIRICGVGQTCMLSGRFGSRVSPVVSHVPIRGPHLPGVSGYSPCLALFWLIPFATRFRPGGWPKRRSSTTNALITRTVGISRSEFSRVSTLD
jgi:hypothetical protein